MDRCITARWNLWDFNFRVFRWQVLKAHERCCQKLSVHLLRQWVSTIVFRIGTNVEVINLSSDTQVNSRQPNIMEVDQIHELVDCFNTVHLELIVEPILLGKAFNEVLIVLFELKERILDG